METRPVEEEKDAKSVAADVTMATTRRTSVLHPPPARPPLQPRRLETAFSIPMTSIGDGGQCASSAGAGDQPDTVSKTRVNRELKKGEDRSTTVAICR